MCVCVDILHRDRVIPKYLIITYQKVVRNVEIGTFKHRLTFTHHVSAMSCNFQDKSQSSTSGNRIMAVENFEHNYYNSKRNNELVE